MIEFIAPIAVGALGLVPRFVRKNERAQIEQVFKNTNFNVKQDGNVKYPHFLKKEDTEFMRRYDYKLPLGLVIDEKLEEKLSSALSKVVEVDGDNIMSVWVYKKNLPTQWKYEDVPNKDGWVVPIGKSYRGMIWHDFDKIPHMTVAGTTRYGKTVLLKGMTTYLAEHHEDDALFYFIDLKGGLEFGRHAKLKQVEGLATNAQEAKELLDVIKMRLNEDMSHFRSKFISDVTDSNINRRIFIVVDEAAQLTPSPLMEKETRKTLIQCQAILSEIARIGGGLGYRLIYCTQYPTGDTLPRQIKQNADAMISFRLKTSKASEVALDEVGAEEIEGKGRLIYKTDRMIQAQAPLINNKEMWSRLEGFEVDKAHAEVREGGTNSNQLRQIGRSHKGTPTDDE